VQGDLLHFRNAGPEDAAALARLGRDTFRETFGHLYRPEDLAAFLATHNEADWRSQLASPDYAVRIAEADAPIAYLKLGPPALPLAYRRPAIELRQFYVLEPWQGAGVAAPLMDWALAEARRRGASDIYLSVFTQNQRAQRFYRRYGFRFVAPYAFMVGEQADEDEIWQLALEEEE
jgi:GNAT superfamily N-acetyltransferase